MLLVFTTSLSLMPYSETFQPVQSECFPQAENDAEVVCLSCLFCASNVDPGPGGTFLMSQITGTALRSTLFKIHA